MQNILSRDMRVFVAGALALIGFRSLIALFYYLYASVYGPQGANFANIGGDIISGVGLPLGIAILLGRSRALLLTKVYLWLIIVSGCGSLFIVYYILYSQSSYIIRRVLPDLVVYIILLWLLILSSSERFQRNQN